MEVPTVELLEGTGTVPSERSALDIERTHHGYEVAQRIRERPWGASMFLIAVTGWGQDEDRQRSSEVGLNVHMVKPVEPSELEKLLAAID